MKSHPKGKEITTVDCSISVGMFKSERMVSVELPGGREIMTLVDRHQVIPDREVSPSEEYKGQVKVTVLEVKNNSTLIDLRQPGITQGTRLMVPKKSLRRHDDPLEGRSTLGRLGLVVHLTAPTIHSGFPGKIVLEMYNFGTYPLRLMPNQLAVCQLIFERIGKIPSGPINTRYIRQRTVR